MNTRVAEREAKLDEQCEIVAALILAARPSYQSATAKQRALLETIIGAGIWYIPKPAGAWTGLISVGALRAFHPASGLEKPRLSEEHVYPRKVTARLLLEDIHLTGLLFSELFRGKYGRVHLITPEENKNVQRFQRATVFTSPEAAYTKASIAFVGVSADELRKVKRRDAATIDRFLSEDPQNIFHGEGIDQ